MSLTTKFQIYLETDKVTQEQVRAIAKYIRARDFGTKLAGVIYSLKVGKSPVIRTLYISHDRLPPYMADHYKADCVISLIDFEAVIVGLPALTFIFGGYYRFELPSGEQITMTPLQIATKESSNQLEAIAPSAREVIPWESHA